MGILILIGVIAFAIWRAWTEPERSHKEHIKYLEEQYRITGVWDKDLWKK